MLGGFLQSLNIKFGTFITKLLEDIITAEGTLQVVHQISGKFLPMEIEENCERVIDEYVDNPPVGASKILAELPKRVEGLYRKIFFYQQSPDGTFHKRTLDANVFFKDEEGTCYYLEVKYNDDHDTGKFRDINRKFLKTYAGLIKLKGFKNQKEFKPILYYFNPSIRYNPNPYLREHIEILRGKEFFEKFNLTIPYEEVETALNKLGETLEPTFDKFREKIFRLVKEQQNQSTLF